MNKFIKTFYGISISLLLGAVSLHAQEEVNVDELVEFDDTQLDRSLNGGVVSYAESLTDARPAVVSVYARSMGASMTREELMMQQLFGITPRRQAPRSGLGSGVIVSENGYIITNNHVISDADEIKVQLDDDKIYDAEMIGTDPSTDIAVLKIDAEGLPSIRFTDSDKIEVGDVVFAIGNPLGVGKTVTMGIVSATERQDMGVIVGGFENFIQTDAPINSGNSGGALIDAQGRLIGINTLIQTDGASTGNIGIGFAVPSNLAYSVLTDLIKNGEVSRGLLGVGIEDLDEDKAEFFGVGSLKGSLVNQVYPGTPAEEVGFQAGDVIVELDGQVIDSASDLRVRIAERKPGEKVSLTIVREKQRRILDVVLAARGADGSIVSYSGGVPASTFLEGVTIQGVNDALREQYEIGESDSGVVVTAVDARSPYARSLAAGMLIRKINGKDVTSYESAVDALNRDGKNMLLISFRGANRWIGIEIED